MKDKEARKRLDRIEAEIKNRPIRLCPKCKCRTVHESQERYRTYFSFGTTLVFVCLTCGKEWRDKTTTETVPFG